MNNDCRGRIVCLLEILKTESDEQHPLSVSDICRLLKETYDISAHRTTIHRDIDWLRAHGIDIITDSGGSFLGERLFETPELMLLADAVHSSKCLTEKKSRDITEKLASLVSRHQAQQLLSRPTAAIHGKPKNEKIYYILDAIQAAIAADKRITFSYTDYSPEKQAVLRGDGEVYTLSPYACMWNGDYYYCIGWCDKHGGVSAFRVDRIAAVPHISGDTRVASPDGFDLEEYSASVFRMYKGELVEVELQCDNELMKTVIDRFGEDVDTDILDDRSFKATAAVSLSPTFYGWVFGFGGKIRILSPASAKEDYRRMAAAVLEN